MSAIENEENWTQIIKPGGGFSAFNLRELWSFRDLIVLFVKRDFVAVYKQTILGPLWHLIQPLFTTAVYVMFGAFVKIEYGTVPPVLFCLSGVIIWNYFASCLTKTSSTFVGNAGIFGKVYFPRLSVPISIIISNLMSFFIQLSLLIPVLLYCKFVKQAPIQPNAYLLFFPVLIILLAMLGLGFGLIVSSLTVRYRDLVYLINFGIQLAIYTAPVIYPLSMLKGKAVIITSLNPVTPFIEMFRYSLLGAGTFSGWDILYGSAFSIISLLTGMLVFSWFERDFMDTV